MPKITVSSLDGFKMQVNDGRHQWQADVPPYAGGGDEGPSPFDMLCGAMAACKCFITRNYAKSANIAVEEVTVDLDGSFREEGKYETFEMKADIKVKGDVSDADLKKLLRAAEACPIKQVVVATTGVATTIGKV